MGRGTLFGDQCAMPWPAGSNSADMRDLAGQHRSVIKKRVEGLPLRSAHECDYAAIVRAGTMQSDACRLLLLLNAVQVIDNSEDARPHNNFRAFLWPGHSPIIGINSVRQIDNGIESFSPNWHFTGTVSGNFLRSIYGFIDSLRWKNPAVAFGQRRQIGRLYFELLADRSFALSIRTMTARA